MSTFQQKLLKKLAEIARSNIQAAIPKQRFGRLQRSIRVVVDGDDVKIYSLYFWARFVNDGRRKVTARAGGPPLIFFKDPTKDPRIKLRYPRTKDDVKPLNKGQYKYHKKRGNLIITREVGPSTGIRFMQKGLQTARKQIPEEIRKRILTDVRQNIRRATDSIIVRL